jgi:hypothetical protein
VPDEMSHLVCHALRRGLVEADLVDARTKARTAELAQ